MEQAVNVAEPERHTYVPYGHILDKAAKTVYQAHCSKCILCRLTTAGIHDGGNRS